MPVTRNLPYSWYDTPNIHFCTIRDFVALCDEVNATDREGDRRCKPDGARIGFNAPWWFWNLFGQQAVFLLQAVDGADAHSSGDPMPRIAAIERPNVPAPCRERAQPRAIARDRSSRGVTWKRRSQARSRLRKPGRQVFLLAEIDDGELAARRQTWSSASASAARHSGIIDSE